MSFEELISGSSSMFCNHVYQHFQVFHCIQRICYGQRLASSTRILEVQVSWFLSHGPCRKWWCVCRATENDRTWL